MSSPELKNYPPDVLKKIVLAADLLQEGHYVFANGGHGLVKIEMDNLWKHPAELDVVLQSLARADGLPKADVILGVPSGGQLLAEAVVERYLIDCPLAKLERIPGGAKQDYRFCTQGDREIAQSARSPRIYEDVVSTLSSVAGVVRLLDPISQDIHSLSIWRRGQVLEIYREGVIDHYLIEEDIPVYNPDECPQCMC